MHHKTKKKKKKMDMHYTLPLDSMNTYKSTKSKPVPFPVNVGAQKVQDHTLD